MLQEEEAANPRLSARWKEIQEVREKRKVDREKKKQDEDPQPTPMEIDDAPALPAGSFAALPPLVSYSDSQNIFIPLTVACICLFVCI